MVLRPFSQADLDRRKIVGVNEETVTNVSSNDFPGHWPGEDHSWDLDQFQKLNRSQNLRIKIHTQPNRYEITFSVVGIDASIANAFRRILLAEIPTVAVENCLVFNNTSIVQDEIICQRIGLIPLRGPKHWFDQMTWKQRATDEHPEGPTTDYNTLVLKLKLKCTKNEAAAKGELDPTKLYHNAHVYARDITFHPMGRQTPIFDGAVVEPTTPDVLIAKLRPGQEIDMDMHCVKGIGADHAKFSPVATASYRLLPTIDIQHPIVGKDAEKFQKCFPPGVIGLESVTAADAAKEKTLQKSIGMKRAVVKDTMRDTVSRECLRYDEFKDKVKLGRVRDHFIFSVESTGQFDGDELFLESVKLLKLKCKRMKRALAKLDS